MRRSSRALQLGLVRNARSGTHLVTFVVAGVSTVLVTRAFLALTGYPQIGGGGLHIAHVLPGGLLMLVAMFLLLSYIGPVIRPLAALLGGIGFGLFIDEIGKFVTSDNNYFFRPTAALIYVVFVLFLFSVRGIQRRALDSREHLANSLDQAVEGVAGGLSDARRAEALRQFSLASQDVPGKAEVRALIDRCEPDDIELPQVAERIQDLVRKVLDRLVALRWTDRVIFALLVIQSIGSSVLAIVPAALGDKDWGVVTVGGVLAGNLLCLGFALFGFIRLHSDSQVATRMVSIRRYQYAVLSLLLITRVFEFATTQFGAVTGLLLDLVLLGLVSAELARLRRLLSESASNAGDGQDFPRT